MVGYCNPNNPGPICAAEVLMKVFLKEKIQSLSPNFAGLACGRERSDLELSE